MYKDVSAYVVVDVQVTLRGPAWPARHYPPQPAYTIIRGYAGEAGYEGWRGWGGSAEAGLLGKHPITASHPPYHPSTAPDTLGALERLRQGG